MATICLGSPCRYTRVLHAALVLVAIGFTACKESASHTAPPGALAYTVGENGKLALALFEDRLVFYNGTKEEASIDRASVNGANFTPGGLMLFYDGGKRAIAYKDYGGKPAREILERVISGTEEAGESVAEQSNDDAYDGEEVEGEGASE